MYFYGIVGIILGIVMIGFAIKLNHDKKHIKSIPFYIVALMYIGVGVYGFFIAEDNYYVILICLIVVCVFTLLSFYIVFNNDKK